MSNLYGGQKHYTAVGSQKPTTLVGRCGVVQTKVLAYLDSSCSVRSPVKIVFITFLHVETRYVGVEKQEGVRMAFTQINEVYSDYYALKGPLCPLQEVVTGLCYGQKQKATSCLIGYLGLQVTALPEIV